MGSVCGAGRYNWRNELLTSLFLSFYVVRDLVGIARLFSCVGRKGLMTRIILWADAKEKVPWLKWQSPPVSLPLHWVTSGALLLGPYFFLDPPGLLSVCINSSMVLAGLRRCSSNSDSNNWYWQMLESELEHCRSPQVGCVPQDGSCAPCTKLSCRHHPHLPLPC